MLIIQTNFNNLLRYLLLIFMVRQDIWLEINNYREPIDCSFNVGYHVYIGLWKIVSENGDVHT